MKSAILTALVRLVLISRGEHEDMSLLIRQCAQTNLQMNMSIELLGKRQRMEYCWRPMVDGRILHVYFGDRLLHDNRQSFDVLTQLGIKLLDARLKRMPTTDLVNALDANLVRPAVRVFHLKVLQSQLTNKVFSSIYQRDLPESGSSSSASRLIIRCQIADAFPS